MHQVERAAAPVDTEQLDALRRGGAAALAGSPFARGVRPASGPSALSRAFGAAVIAATRLDRRAQEDCATGCAAASLGNGVCEPECDVVGCRYDEGDCLSRDDDAYAERQASEDGYEYGDWCDGGCCSDFISVQRDILDGVSDCDTWIPIFQALSASDSSGRLLLTNDEVEAACTSTCYSDWLARLSSVDDASDDWSCTAAASLHDTIEVTCAATDATTGDYCFTEFARLQAVSTGNEGAVLTGGEVASLCSSDCLAPITEIAQVLAPDGFVYKPSIARVVEVMCQEDVDGNLCGASEAADVLLGLGTGRPPASGDDGSDGYIPDAPADFSVFCSECGTSLYQLAAESLPDFRYRLVSASILKYGCIETWNWDDDDSNDVMCGDLLWDAVGSAQKAAFQGVSDGSPIGDLLTECVDLIGGCTDSCTPSCQRTAEAVSDMYGCCSFGVVATAMSIVVSSEGASEGECAQGCRLEWVGDDVCDPACLVEECGFDEGDCVFVEDCAEGCPPQWPGDGVCDPECHVESCHWDFGDCDDRCDPRCPQSWRGDGICDLACWNEACGNDGGDCDECSPGCSAGWPGNGVCDAACMTEQCSNDLGDCGSDGEGSARLLLELPHEVRAAPVDRKARAPERHRRARALAAAERERSQSPQSQLQGGVRRAQVCNNVEVDFESVQSIQEVLATIEELVPPAMSDINARCRNANLPTHERCLPSKGPTLWIAVDNLENVCAQNHEGALRVAFAVDVLAYVALEGAHVDVLDMNPAAVGSGVVFEFAFAGEEGAPLESALRLVRSALRAEVDIELPATLSAATAGSIDCRVDTSLPMLGSTPAMPPPVVDADDGISSAGRRRLSWWTALAVAGAVVVACRSRQA